ncbi:DUF2298 domain-containing protein [Methanorbis furvi]|uniref:YYY membrane protein n=1 Tax=Methanorbis furvi TaxID=3028299 RepID=A0AAE4MDP4_9EURY|nr:hypothetical protein [Methanocorpusculaceae archaeon Ag1]
MISPEMQIVTVVLWLIVIKFCQMTVYPYLKLAVTDLAYGLSYPFSILILTFVSWYLGVVGLPIQLALLPFALAGVYALICRKYDIEEMKKNLRWDLVFLGAFALMLISRFLTPGIIPSGEKFMDAAFLGSIMLDPSVTPLDPWYAGGELSIYYYLGHWMCGVLGVFTGGASTVIFNLMLPTVFALAAISAYAVGVLLLKRHQWIPMLVLVIPNAALIWHIFSGAGAVGIWWASTRVIENTINEYPLFSFLWGDPHAHVLGCFNQLFFLCLLSVMLVRWKLLPKAGKYLLAVMLALSLGTMPAMNSWDVMVYAAVYIVVAAVVWIKEGHTLRDAVPLALVPVLSLASYAPFLYTMISEGGSSVQGFFLVTTPSAINEFLGVYLFFVAVFVIYGFSVLKKYPWLIAVPIVFAVVGYAAAGVALFCILLLLGKKSSTPEIVFGILGMVIVFLMEVVYLKDYMGDVYYRMNTVFKFGFCAWFMLGASALLMIGSWVSDRFAEVSRKRAVAAAVVVFIVLASMIGFFGIHLGYPGGTLDGAAWLEVSHPADAAGISFLTGVAVPGDVIVEAADGSYEYNGRVSAMTGLPTIVGWVGHEVGWRNGVGDAGTRWTEVRAIYEDPSRTLDLMDKYGAKYLFVGEVEQQKYNLNLPDEGLIEIFTADGVSIYQRGD